MLVAARDLSENSSFPEFYQATVTLSFLSWAFLFNFVWKTEVNRDKHCKYKNVQIYINTSLTIIP